MLCGLSSTISFKKDQHLKSSTIDNIKGKKGGRQQGVKAMLKASANKKEEEKEKEKAKDGEGGDDDLSQKSWSDSDDSSDGGQKGKGRKKKGEKQMVIKDIFEQEVPEPPKKPTAKETETANKVTPQAANEEEGSDGKSSANDKDSDDDSNSSFDFE